MARRDRTRGGGGGSRLPHSLRRDYVERLHRRPSRWDVLVWALSQTLAKRCDARRSMLAAAGLPLPDREIPGVALMLARGFDLHFARELARDEALARSVDAGIVDEAVAARLTPSLAAECFEPLLRKYAEDSAERYLPRPSPPLEQLAAQLAAVTADLLLTRCAPGGDLRDALASPAQDAGDSFPDNDMPADPPAGSGRASVDVRRLQVHVHDTDGPAEIKRKLLGFTLNSPWLAEELARHLESTVDALRDDELSHVQGARINAVDEFLYSPTRLAGKTPVELLIEQQPDMPEVHRRRLLRWSDETFVGVFLLKDVRDSFVSLMDIRDDEEYRVFASDPDVFRELAPGTLMLTRLAPWDDHWVMSGAQHSYGQVSEPRLASIRRGLPAVGAPHRARRNEPDPNEQKARELQLEQYQEWVKFFGHDELLFDDGHKLKEALDRFMDHLTFHVVNPENGLTPAQAHERDFGGPPTPPRIAVPEHMLESDDVAVLMDPLMGMRLLEGYGLFRSAFASEAPPTAAQVRAVWEFLREESYHPSIFLRMRDRFPNRTEEMMRLVLKDRLFRLDRDFEPTLRKFKGRAMRRPPRPPLTLVDHAEVPDYLEERARRESHASSP